MKKAAIILLILFSLYITPAFAETTIEAKVDKVNLTTDEALTYQIIITSSDQKLPKIKIPDFKGFAVISQSESSRLSFFKDGSKTILAYTFILVPTDIGKFTIEPSVMKRKAKTYSTQAFEIEVVQGKAKPQPKLKPEPSLPEETQPESKQAQITL